VSIIYNADEIYEIAITIEKNGKAFYDMAAETVDDKDVQKVMRDLSAWEDRHIELFKSLRDGLRSGIKGSASFDGNEESLAYMKAAADSHVFVQNFDMSYMVAQCKIPRAALDMALRFEKDSVVYYATAKNLVPEHLGRADVGRIEDEEIRHVSILHKQIRLLTDN